MSMQQYTVSHTEELERHLPSLEAADAIAVAVRTSGSDIHRDRITCIRLAVDGGPEVRIECPSFLPSGLPVLQKALSTPAVKVFANAARELPFLTVSGATPADPLFDVDLVSRLLRIAAMREDAGEYQKECAAIFSGNDCIGAPELLRARKTLLPHVVRNKMIEVTDIELRCIRAIAHMHSKGVYLDLVKWERLTESVKNERAAALARLVPFLGGPATRPSLWGDELPYGHNLDSSAYVLRLLKRHGITVTSTAWRELARHQEHPLVRALGAYRKASKALSSFLLPYPGMVHPATGRLHPHYEQLTAFSGRMSCHHPNIQQIPREKAFRECFTAPPGHSLIVADYSQIELRVAAQISRDSRMLAAYQAGEDLHLLTASHLAGKPMELISKQERQAYKAVNLGLIYGMGAAGLRETARQSYGVEMPIEQATLFRRRFFETYTGIREWHERIKGGVAQEGYTLTGRRFPFSPEAGLPERSNLPVQGTAADIIKKALGLLVRSLPPHTWIVAVVHDEILLECPEDSAQEAALLLRSTMEEAANSILPDVPTSVEAVISTSWAEK